MLFLTLGLILLIAVTAYLVRRRAPHQDALAVKTRTAKSVNPHSSVELQPGINSCAEAKALSGTRLLVSEAPILPFEGCDRHCRCAYKPHADRRSENRRRIDDGLPEEVIYASGDDKRRSERRAG